MLGGARRRERARDGEQHDRLTFEQIVGGKRLGAVGSEARELALRHLVAYFDGHEFCSWTVRKKRRGIVGAPPPCDQRSSARPRIGLLTPLPDVSARYWLKAKSSCVTLSASDARGHCVPGSGAARALFDMPRPFLDHARSDESSD